MDQIQRVQRRDQREAALTPASLKAASGIFAAALFLTSCGHQDPFQDQPEAVRQGKPPEVVVQDPGSKPIPDGSMKITAPMTEFFAEGEEREIDISGRVLVPGFDQELSIENLDEFPGATFDAATGKFKWKPSKGVVIDAGNIQPRSLRVRLAAKRQDGTGIVYTTNRSVAIIVTRTPSKPEIVSIDSWLGKNPIREGETRVFEVVVRDSDLGGKTPILEATPVTGIGSADVFQHVHLKASESSSDVNPSVDANDPSLWKFKMVFDASGREFTKKEEVFKFALRATSKFGAVATSPAISVFIRTDLTLPELTWSDRDDVKVYAEPGKRLLYCFDAYDPREEGRLQVTIENPKDGGLPGEAKTSCENKRRPIEAEQPPSLPPLQPGQRPNVPDTWYQASAKTCCVEWNVPQQKDLPDATVKDGFGRLEFALRTSSPVVGDAYSKTRTAVRRVYLKASPQEPPKPATPTPPTPVVPAGGPT